MGIRVVSDSSADLFEVQGIDYVTVPLQVTFGGRVYVDTAEVDTAKMMQRLSTHKGPSTTSCPNTYDWLSAFEGSDEIFAATISSGLSASYESCTLAKNHYQQSHPEAKVHIFDSKATGPVLHLIIDHLAQGIRDGLPYEQIKEETIAFQKRIRILYALESLNNLANNGRVNMAVAKIAGVLGIRVIGHASDEGKVDILHKARGQKRALATIVHEMSERGFTGGKAIIDHCLNAEGAKRLADLILEHFPTASVSIVPCGVLCSYYADMGGLILGYEVAE